MQLFICGTMIIFRYVYCILYHFCSGLGRSLFQGYSSLGQTFNSAFVWLLDLGWLCVGAFLSLFFQGLFRVHRLISGRCLGLVSRASFLPSFFASHMSFLTACPQSSHASLLSCFEPWIFETIKRNVTSPPPRQSTSLI